ncbi:MAG: bifunctional nuclease family protein [Deltaproteobacteria bacterium]|nr:bifunctional nuclease family protein [Deltaproteobacteria bacterium]
MLIEMKVSALAVDPYTNTTIVILKDIGEKNALPIWIGFMEASAIAVELEKIKLSRPMTHDLLKEILKMLDVNVKRIEVNDLKDNVYYATIHLSFSAEGKEKLHLIDSRPSDAIALAIRTACPIFVDEKVIEKSRNIDLRKVKEFQKDGTSEDWKDILENLSPEEFGKYKM